MKRFKLFYLISEAWARDITEDFCVEEAET